MLAGVIQADMKTMTIKTESVSGISQSLGFLGRVIEERPIRKSRVPAWLPAPKTVPQRQGVAPATGRKPATSIWIAPPGEALGAKVLLGLLVVAAAAGVSYGVSMLLDLVGNWASVQAGIGQLIP